MNSRHYIRLVLSASAAAIGILAARIFVRCGADFMDEPYELMNAVNPLDCPLAPLSAWIGNWLASHSSPTLISLRWSSFLTTLASVAIATILCRKRLISSKGGSYAALSFGVATLLAAPHVESWLYGWDIYSNALLTVTLAWLCLLIRRPSLPAVFIAGALAGAAALCRVPNVLLFPAVAVAAAAALPRSRWRAVAIASAAFAAVISCFILISYGSIGNYLDAIAANHLGGHSLFTLVRNTFSGMVWFAPLLCSSISLFLLLRYADMHYGHKSWRFLSLACAGALLLGLIFRLTVWKYVVVEQMAECIVIPLLLYPLFCRKPVGHATKLLAVVALWTGLCAVAGSNTGFIKFLSIGMFPVAVAISRPWQSRPLGTWLLLMIAIYCCVAGSVRCMECYKDVGPAYARHTITLPGHPMNGTRTTKEFAEYSEKAYTLARDLRDHGYEVRVLAPGLNRFGWIWITGAPMTVDTHNWDEQNMSVGSSPAFRAAMQEALSLPHVAVIVPAPFSGEVQCREFAPCDDDLIATLSARLHEEPSGIHGVRLFCSVPRQK